MERRDVNPWTWQEQFGYVQANEISGMERVLVCAGQTSVDADGDPLHGVRVTWAPTAGQALDNFEAVLGEAGFALSDVIRLNYYVTDIDAFLQAGEIWGARLGAAGCRAAGSLLGVAGLAFPQLLVEIEATAAKQQKEAGGGT